MCDDDICQVPPAEMAAPRAGLSRREFALSAAAAATLAATHARAAEMVVETSVDIKTDDGTCDAALFHPQGSGPWPGVLIWTDNRTLRPVFRDMGRRLAAQGYTVLVPNPYYRKLRAPTQGQGFDFENAQDAAKLTVLSSTLTADGTDRDAKAFIAYLDAQPHTDKKKPVGVQGYCMGGPLAFRTAAVLPDRIGALMTCHGGNLVNDKPDSPHLLIAKMKAEAHCAVAHNDDQRQPDAKDKLKAGFDKAGLVSKVQVYPGNHGWCVKDNPVYDEAAAERAWAELSDLYKRRLTSA